MAEFFQAVLPSGMCMRFRALKTKERLDIQRDLTAKGKKDDVVEMQVQTLARCIAAHTVPQPWIFKKVPKKNEHGNDTSEMVDSNIADTDAMLAAVPANAWIQDTPLSLIVEGASVVDLLSSLPDYEVAWEILHRASGFGIDRPLVTANPNKVSVG